MLLEEVWQFHEANTAWAITGNEYSPMYLDTEVVTPRFNLTREVWLWIMVAVAADFTTENETYQFQLRSGTAKTGAGGTTIDGTVTTHVCSANMAGNDARLKPAGKLAFVCALPSGVFSRYIQLYCETAGNTPIVSVYAGLACSKSAIPTARDVQALATNIVAPT